MPFSVMKMQRDAGKTGHPLDTAFNGIGALSKGGGALWWVKGSDSEGRWRSDVASKIKGGVTHT